MERMLDRLKIEGLSPRSQQYALGTFFRIWKHAAKRKFVKAGENPAMGLQIERINNIRLRVLTPKELNDILRFLEVNDSKAYELTFFCAFTGCRFSEAARLTWEYIDLERGTALFPQTKNKDSREIFLPSQTIALLKTKGIGATGQYVFTKKDGIPFKEPPSAFSTAVKKLELNKDRGKRDTVSFHTLRHTAATMASRRKIPVKDLQHIFGWKTPTMVFRYVKGSEEIQRDAMQGLAQSLTGETGKIIPLEENLACKEA